RQRQRRPARGAALSVKRLILLGFMLLASPARAELLPLPGAGRVDVRYEPGLEPIARQLQAGAEDSLARIGDDLVDLPAPRHVHVQLVRDAASLASVAPAGRGAPAWAIGVAYPDLGVISVATRRGPQLTDPLSTLRHELAHVALRAAI